MRVSTTVSFVAVCTRACVRARAYLRENVNFMQKNKISLCLEIILIGIRFNERRGDCSYLYLYLYVLTRQTQKYETMCV